MKAPKPVAFAVEDYGEIPREEQPAWERMFSSLNPFLQETTAMFDQGISPQNMAVTIKTVEVRQPALPWITPTFTNNWTGGSYIIDDYGFVRLDGKLTTSGAINTAAWTMPVGYRPAIEVHLAGMDDANAAAAIKITTAGVVTPVTGTTTGTWVTGLSYPATAPAAVSATSGPGWPIALTPGFKAPVAGVWLIQAMDLATGVSQSHGASGVDWTTNRQGQVEVRRVFGLSPEHSYRLTFLLLAGDG